MTKIYITQYDLERLQKLLNKRMPHDEYEEALQAELSRAEIVDSKSIPPDTITMNSTVRFKDKDGKSSEYTLVFPEDADLSKNKMSILSPIGCSLIGYTVGSSVTIPAPKGRKKLKVEEIVYQPERAGDYNN